MTPRPKQSGWFLCPAPQSRTPEQQRPPCYRAALLFAGRARRLGCKMHGGKALRPPAAAPADCPGERLSCARIGLSVGFSSTQARLPSGFWAAAAKGGMDFPAPNNGRRASKAAEMPNGIISAVFMDPAGGRIRQNGRVAIIAHVVRPSLPVQQKVPVEKPSHQWFRFCR